MEIKPDACIVGDKVGIFIGADYRFLNDGQLDKFIRLLQKMKARRWHARKVATREARKAAG